MKGVSENGSKRLSAVEDEGLRALVKYESTCKAFQQCYHRSRKLDKNEKLYKFDSLLSRHTQLEKCSAELSKTRYGPGAKVVHTVWGQRPQDLYQRRTTLPGFTKVKRGSDFAASLKGSTFFPIWFYRALNITFRVSNLYPF